MKKQVVWPPDFFLVRVWRTCIFNLHRGLPFCHMSISLICGCGYLGSCAGPVLCGAPTVAYIVRLTTISCHVPVHCNLALMAVARNGTKLVFRSARVTSTGRRKVVGWSEYCAHAVPAARKLEKHGKRPGKHVRIEMQSFTKRISSLL